MRGRSMPGGSGVSRRRPRCSSFFFRGMDRLGAFVGSFHPRDSISFFRARMRQPSANISSSRSSSDPMPREPRQRPLRSTACATRVPLMAPIRFFATIRFLRLESALLAALRATGRSLSLATCCSTSRAKPARPSDADLKQTGRFPVQDRGPHPVSVDRRASAGTGARAPFGTLCLGTAQPGAVRSTRHG